MDLASTKPKLEKTMNILEQKVNHPTKGQLELGRWSKQDLVKVLLEQNRVILNQQNQAYWYKLLYGFNIG
jgi:hypothetical protein